VHRMWIGAVAVVGTGLGLAAPASAQEAPDSLPLGVTAAMIADGAKLFTGQGICQACHGPQGKGIPNLGADLTDAAWRHGDGSYDKILETITQGVDPSKSSTGAAMPPKGGSNLSEDQLKAVAAYVWSLSRGS